MKVYAMYAASHILYNMHIMEKRDLVRWTHATSKLWPIECVNESLCVCPISYMLLDMHGLYMNGISPLIDKQCTVSTNSVILDLVCISLRMAHIHDVSDVSCMENTMFWMHHMAAMWCVRCIEHRTCMAYVSILAWCIMSTLCIAWCILCAWCLTHIWCWKPNIFITSILWNV